MNIEQLKQLISKGESDRLEFKKSTTQNKAAFETLCAFLNGVGGTILIGVTDNGQMVGQQVSDQTKQELARELSKIEPKPSPEIHYVDISEDKQVIIIETSPGSHMPYAYDGRPFERNQSTTERMSQHRYEQCIVQRGQLNHNWEEYLAKDYTLDDLDHEEIRRTVKEGVDKNRIGTEALNYSIEQILTNFQLMKHDKLTNAAVVLYAKDPAKFFSQCEIKMARFRGIDKSLDFIDSLWASGNAFKLITDAHHFASRHLPIAGFFEPGKWQRTDQPAVPALALREALINAICHRDYTIRSMTTSLAIFDDRLEVWNPGELLPQLKIENLKIPHRSVLRNKLIAQVFYKRGWIETWGMGTLRMTDYCKNNKTPEPEFKENQGGFSVIFRFKEAMQTVIIHTNEPLQQELSTRQQEIVNILSQVDQMALKDIHQRLQKPPAERTLREDLTTLKQIGLINSQGQSRATTWFLVKK